MSGTDDSAGANRPPEQRDAAQLAAILEDDAAFQQAVAFAVATTCLAVKPTAAKPAAPFPPALREATLRAASAYERAVTAQWRGRRCGDLAELDRLQRAVEDRRRRMRYRVMQGLCHLGLETLVEREEFPRVRHWRDGDDAEDRVLRLEAKR